MGFTAQKVTVSPDLSCRPKKWTKVFRKIVRDSSNRANIRVCPTNIPLSHVEGMLAGMLEVDHFWQPLLVDFTRRRGFPKQNGNLNIKTKFRVVVFSYRHSPSFPPPSISFIFLSIGGKSSSPPPPWWWSWGRAEAKATKTTRTMMSLNMM